MAEEVHWARVRAAVAAAALRKGGRARAVVQAVRVAGGGGTMPSAEARCLRRPLDLELPT